MKTKLQIVENNPYQRIPSVVLSIGTVQFLFNIIPSLVRHRRMHRINLHRNSYIFFTKNSAETVGGLPNYLLFRSGTQHSNEAIANNINLYGDSQIINHLQKMRFKLGMKAIRFAFTNWRKTKYRLGVKSLHLFKKLKQDPKMTDLFVKIEDYLKEKCQKKDYFDSRYFITNETNKYISIQWNHYHNDLIDIYPVISNNNQKTFTNYICILAQKIGNKDVNYQRFMDETSIRNKKLIKIFKNKGFLQFEGKKFQKNNYLYQKDFKPSNIMILHHSSVQIVEELMKNHLLGNYFENKNKTGLVVHILQNISILQQPVFKEFINLFQQDTKHLWFNQQFNEIKEKKQLEQNLLQLQFWNQIFPCLQQKCFTHRINSKNKNVNIIQENFPILKNILYQRTFSFNKNQQKEDTYAPIIESKPKKSKLQILKEVIQKNSSKIKELQKLQLQAPKNHQPKVIMFGTNSSMPMPDRNAPGILLQMNKKDNILLDCGQQTFQQMSNHFSPQNFYQQLVKVKVIFISHIHSDNNLGLCNFISQRQRILKQRGIESKVYLIIPFNVLNWYAEFNDSIEDLSSSCDIIFTQLLEQEKGQFVEKDPYQVSQFADIKNSVKTKQLVQRQLPFQKARLKQFHYFLKSHDYELMSPIRVIHCVQSFGIVIKNKQFKVSYSGDTRPCETFANAALGSDLLIHEATFDDRYAREAKEFKHSTLNQAIQIGLKSKSSKVILTHFSSKIKLPDKLRENDDYFQKNAIIAFDHLQIPLKNNDHLTKITKLISQLTKIADNKFVESYQFSQQKQND